MYSMICQEGDFLYCMIPNQSLHLTNDAFWYCKSVVRWCNQALVNMQVIFKETASL